MDKNVNDVVYGKPAVNRQLQYGGRPSLLAALKKRIKPKRYGEPIKPPYQAEMQRNDYQAEMRNNTEMPQSVSPWTVKDRNTDITIDNNRDTAAVDTQINAKRAAEMAKKSAKDAAMRKRTITI